MISFILGFLAALAFICFIFWISSKPSCEEEDAFCSMKRGHYKPAVRPEDFPRPIAATLSTAQLAKQIPPPGKPAPLHVTGTITVIIKKTK